MPKGYTTKQKIENYLLINIDDSFDDQVDDWIEAVEAEIDARTGRSFFPLAEGSEESRFFDGNGSNELSIDETVSITELKIDDEEVDSDDYETIPYNQTPIKRIRLLTGYFNRGNKNVEIEGRWGRTLPKDIELIATIMVAGIINYAWSSEGEVASITVGRYSVSYKNEKQKNDIDQVDATIKRYKKYTF